MATTTKNLGINHLAIRRELACRGLIDTTHHTPLFALAAQFLCGYRDIDLRDTTGLGHGALIARYGNPATCQRWIPRLLGGELAGIAITEPHGGSNPAACTTTATPTGRGNWLVTGRKTWISRLTEAAVWIVFFHAPNDTLAAAAIDANTTGLHRQPITPAGLAGWTWGILDLDSVVVEPEDVLVGDAMTLLRLHFTRYRPLVTATALGAAAAVFDTVTVALYDRQAAGIITRPRDSALMTIGRAHAQLTAALLGTVVAAHLSQAGHPTAQWLAAEAKAHGIEIANQAAAELGVLLGATGFRAESQAAKVRRDLNGLLYADGIHDSLYRAAGRHHTLRSTTTTSPRAWESLPKTA